MATIPGFGPGLRAAAWGAVPGVLAVAGIAAQTTVVVPNGASGNFGNEGHSAVVLPFHDQNMILQQWLPAADVGLPDGARILGLAFLRESNAGAGPGPGFLQSAAWVLDRVELRLGPAAATFTTDGVANWDAGRIPAAVFAQSGFAVPGYLSPAATAPGGVELARMTFTRAVQYDATKPLLLEVRNVASTQTNRNPPGGGVAVSDRSLPAGFAAVRGWGCANGQGAVAGYGGFGGGFVRGATTTASIEYRGTTAVGAWAMLIGFQFATTLGQAPGLPLRLVPGLDGVGADCRLWVDPAIVVAGTGTTFPQTFSLPIPAATPAGLAVGWQPLFVDTLAPGLLTVGPGLYAYVRTAAQNHATRVGVFLGDGDTSATANPQPGLTTVPLQDYAVTVKFFVQ